MTFRQDDIWEVIEEHIRALKTRRRRRRKFIPEGFQLCGGRSWKRPSNRTGGKKTKRQQHLDRLATERRRERQDYLPKWRPLAELLAAMPVGTSTVHRPAVPDVKTWAAIARTMLKHGTINRRLRISVRVRGDSVTITRMQDWPVVTLEATRLEKAANVQWFRFITAMKQIVSAGNPRRI